MRRLLNIMTLSPLLLGLPLAACQQTPSVAEATEACQRSNVSLTSIEFGQTFTSTQPEKATGIPQNVPIYPVKVTYRLPAVGGVEREEMVSRNLYENVYGELVCD